MIANILLVEDDKNIREFLSNALMESDFGVKSTGDGAKALSLIKEDNIDLVILDLGIENVSGETAKQKRLSVLTMNPKSSLDFLFECRRTDGISQAHRQQQYPRARRLYKYP